MRFTLLLAVFCAAVVPGISMPTDPTDFTPATAQSEFRWPSIAVPDHLARRKAERGSSLTNGERIQRGLPLAKPKPKRMINGPEEARASGNAQVYYAYQCVSELSSRTGPYTFPANDLQTAANICASYNDAGPGAPGASYFALFVPINSANVECYINVAWAVSREMCRSNNIALYSPTPDTD